MSVSTLAKFFGGACYIISLPEACAEARSPWGHQTIYQSRPLALIAGHYQYHS